MALVSSNSFAKKEASTPRAIDAAATRRIANDAFNEMSTEIKGSSIEKTKQVAPQNAIEKTKQVAPQNAIEKTKQVAPQNAIEKMKQVASQYFIEEKEIIGDLDKDRDYLKKKVAEMDTAKILAYLSTYKDVFEITQIKTLDYSEQLSNLKWYEGLSANAKEIKKQLAQYTNRNKALKEQATIYVKKLEAKGIKSADYGIDLSAYLR